jgi:hypothetical protein
MCLPFTILHPVLPFRALKNSDRLLICILMTRVRARWSHARMVGPLVPGMSPSQDFSYLFNAIDSSSFVGQRFNPKCPVRLPWRACLVTRLLLISRLGIVLHLFDSHNHQRRLLSSFLIGRSLRSFVFVGGASRAPSSSRRPRALLRLLRPRALIALLRFRRLLRRPRALLALRLRALLALLCFVFFVRGRFSRSFLFAVAVRGRSLRSYVFDHFFFRLRFLRSASQSSQDVS